MERFDDHADLAAALRALRPTPRPAFAAELDERAAAGFPRRSPEGSAAASPLAWVRSLHLRQVLLPAGATALVAIVLTTAVVAVEEDGSVRPAGDRRSVTSEFGQGPLVKPERAFKRGFESATNGFAETEVTQPFSKASVTPLQGAAVSASAAESLSASRFDPLSASEAEALSAPRHRDVERAAEMVLGVEPAELSDASSEAFAAVHRYDGIVLRSSTRSGAAGNGRAEFELLIPSARLGDALAAFSQIGEVQSRHEATTDITAPTVTAGERLRDSRARIDGLLAQLSEATTDSEREAVEAELATERRHAAFLRTRLEGLDRRASLSRVSLRIESGAGASPQGNTSWGVGAALGDAGHILGIAAGVTLVGLAILAPFALIVVLAWLAQRTIVRRNRERALG